MAKEEVNRRGRKEIFKGGQGWTMPAQPGQLRTGEDGQGLL